VAKPVVTNNFGGAVSFAASHAPVTTLYGIPITGRTIVGPADTSADLHGGRANDSITGGSQPDVIIGGRGDDVLTGGVPTPGQLADDTFVFHRGSGNDVITDFSGDDTINIASYLRRGAQVTVTDTPSGDTVIQLDRHDSITLIGVASSDLIATDTGFTHSQLLVG
jgi:Ca2+-binding RTX toxin-like protein